MVFKPFNVTKESTKLQLNLGLQQKKGRTNFTFNTGFTTTKLQ